MDLLQETGRKEILEIAFKIKGTALKMAQLRLLFYFR